MVTEQPEKSSLLSHYTHALHLLHHHGGEPAHDLAKRLGASKQTFALFMSTLVRAGLVERKPRPKTFDHTWDHTAFSYYLSLWHASRRLADQDLVERGGKGRTPPPEK